MNILFVFYVLISVIAISGSMYLNSRPGAMSGAIVMSILFLLVSVYFGTRWFTPSGNSNIGTNISTTWPPPNSINICPDYTVLSQSAIEGNNKFAKYTCIDTNGVSTNGPGKSIVLNNPSGSNSNFRSAEELCSDCKDMGLTWEGICITGSSAPLNSTVVPPRPV